MTSEIHPMLAALQATLSPDQFQAFQPILELMDHRIAAAEASAVNTVQIRTALEAALANARFTVQVPQQAPPPPAPPTTRTPSIKADLPTFHGRETDDVRAWFSVMEDFLNGQHVSPSDWVLQVAVLLRDDALRTYLALKRRFTASGQPVTWQTFRAELEKRYDSPLRVETFRGDLRDLQYDGDLVRYIDAFRRIESQIHETDMVFADRLSYFLSHLPSDLARDIRRDKPTDTDTMYHSAREISRLNRIDIHPRPTDARTSAAKKKVNFSRPWIPFPATHSLVENDRVDTLPAVSSMEPQDTAEPMDLDVMVQGHTAARPARGRATNIRCYTCQGMGHYARDCPVLRQVQQAGAEMHTMEIGIADEDLNDEWNI